MRHRLSRPPPVGFNITPMIDIVFLLIIFFVLVSVMGSAENVRMKLPEPSHSQARKVKLSSRIIINVRPSDVDAPDSDEILYSLGPNRPQPLDQLAESLSASKAATPDLKVVIRADRRLPYAAVREVMKIVAENQIEMMNVVAHVGVAGEER